MSLLNRSKAGLAVVLYLGGSGTGEGGSGNGFGGANGNGNGGFNGGNGQFGVGFDITTASYYRTIHGILCALSMVVLFPLGSIFMRIIPGRFALWIHAVFQMLAFCVYVAGAALGIYLVTIVQIPFEGGNLLTNDTTKFHPIIGIVTLATLVVQPILGYVHHARFKKVQRRQFWSYLHIFNGRIGVTVGIINGGLGLNLAAASAYRKRVYIIVAAVMWSLWMLIALVSEVLRLRRNRRARKVADPHAVMTSAKAIPVEVRSSHSRSVGSHGSHGSHRSHRSHRSQGGNVNRDVSRSRSRSRSRERDARRSIRSGVGSIGRYRV
ncbi:hypothetical protein B0H67DRAFT_600558 [Lasiosphaeris hirsuta]|uniref:Cytochrome b561 domain-containing protein n=1 Tax=Lasiosphaeris hirsuta TaxID=260670 RepID=A0AA40AF76_9PEZI|nr:hypothetical protein B0H67DRAFT_600558 [Lasiosphaeris hirsuta]